MRYLFPLLLLPVLALAQVPNPVTDSRPFEPVHLVQPDDQGVFRYVPSNSSGQMIAEPAAMTVAFETATNLGNAEVYDSGVLAYGAASQVQTEVLSDQDGTMTFTFYADDAGTDQIRQLTVSYVAAEGYRQFGAPTFGRSVRYQFTNGATPTTDFFFSTKFVSSSISPQVLAVDSFISPAMLSTLQRSVIVGVEGGGSYENVTVVETTNDAGTYHSLQVVSGARPSEVTGRVETAVTLDGVTADELSYTVTADKTFFVTDILLTVVNSASGSAGEFKLRDGLTVAGAVVLPLKIDEAPGSGTSLTTIAHAFTEPISFSTGVFFDEVAGTLDASGVIRGYEE